MFVPQNSPRPLFHKGSVALQALAGFPFPLAGLYPSARAALLAWLRGRPGNGRVWLPAFMCRSLLKPLQASHLELKFYDVDRQLMPRWEDLEVCPGDYFLFVHFFGMYRPMAEVSRFCREHGMLLIEDCAHILPDPQAPVPAGATGDVAIFSLRKLLAVPDGGMLIDRRGESEISEAPRGNGPGPTGGGRKKAALMWAESLAFQTQINLLPVKKLLRRMLGTTDSPTLAGDLDGVVRRLDGLPRNDSYLTAIVSRRKENYRYLGEALAKVMGVEIPSPSLPPGSCPQVFPVIVSNPTALMEQLHRQGIEAGIWPGEERIPMPLLPYPGTRFWQERLLILPVHHELKMNHLDLMAAILKRSI